MMDHASIDTVLRIACESACVKIQPPLSYRSMPRLVSVHGDIVSPKTDYGLAKCIVEAANMLMYEERVGERVVSVQPIQSVALLYDKGEASITRPHCFIASVGGKQGTGYCRKLVVWAAPAKAAEASSADKAARSKGKR